MTDPDLPPIDAMRGFLLRFIQDVKHRDGIRVAPENEREFLILFGLMQRVRRLVQGYLRLERAGFANEGSLLARAALEHAVTAQWAYLIRGGIDRLHVTLGRASADLALGMIDYSSDSEWVAIEKELREQVPKGKGLPKFTGPGGIMADLDAVKFLGASYRVLSQVGHVTSQAMMDFLREEQGEVRLSRNPEVVYQREVLYALTGFAMLVAWIQARLDGDDAEVSLLESAAGDLRVPYRLDRDLAANRCRFS
jgi:hypothetical protein